MGKSKATNKAGIKRVRTVKGRARPGQSPKHNVVPHVEGDLKRWTK